MDKYTSCPTADYINRCECQAGQLCSICEPAESTSTVETSEPRVALTTRGLRAFVEMLRRQAKFEERGSYYDTDEQRRINSTKSEIYREISSMLSTSFDLEDD